MPVIRAPGPLSAIGPALRRLRVPPLLPLALGIAIVGLVAALTHVCAILLLPHVATRDSYDLLAARGLGRGGITILPPARPGDTMIPFRDPAAVQGLCFYDLAKAPVRVRVMVPEGRLLSLSFRTREGLVFYSMTDRAALHGTIDIRLVTQAQLDEVSAGDDEDAGLPEELRLKVPAPAGLVVATALVARPGDRAEAEARVKAIECRPEPLPPPA